MSERDEVVVRLGDVGIWVSLPDGTCEEDWALGRVNARAVLEEIEAAGWGPACECEDCYPELTAAAGVPLPEGVTSVTWGWGDPPEREE